MKNLILLPTFIISLSTISHGMDVILKDLDDKMIHHVGTNNLVFIFIILLNISRI